MNTKERGYLAELWGNENGSHGRYLLSPYDSETNSWWVVNGAFEVFPNKEKGTIGFYRPFGPKELRVINCTYIGDVLVFRNQNGDDDYNRTFREYEDTGTIVSKNKVGFKKKKEPKNKEEDGVPF